MSTVQDLTSIVPPPSDIVTAWDWDQIHRDLGFVTPSDYQQIINAYGNGKFDDFLRVFAPTDLSSQIKTKREALHMSADSEELFGVPPEVMPYPIESLAACAYSDNGDVIYWRTQDSADPNKWPVVIHATRDEEWDEYEGTILDFLVAIFDRSYVCPLFPDSFPDANGSMFAPQ